MAALWDEQGECRLGYAKITLFGEQEAMDFLPGPGLAAGIRTLVALFGYLGEEDDPAAWGAHGLVAHPGEILSYNFV